MAGFELLHRIDDQGADGWVATPRERAEPFREPRGMIRGGARKPVES